MLHDLHKNEDTILWLVEADIKISTTKLSTTETVDTSRSMNANG